MIKIFLPVLFLGLALAAGCGGNSASSQADGKALYTANCVQCHGADGGAGALGAADLRKSTMDDGTMFATIKEGKGTMTGFASVLSDKEVYAVIHYVKGLRK